VEVPKPRDVPRQLSGEVDARARGAFAVSDPAPLDAQGSDPGARQAAHERGQGVRRFERVLLGRPVRAGQEKNHRVRTGRIGQHAHGAQAVITDSDFVDLGMSASVSLQGIRLDTKVEVNRLTLSHGAEQERIAGAACFEQVTHLAQICRRIAVHVRQEISRPNPGALGGGARRNAPHPESRVNRSLAWRGGELQTNVATTRKTPLHGRSVATCGEDGANERFHRTRTRDRAIR
jgi:hypothetical protein